MHSSLTRAAVALALLSTAAAPAAAQAAPSKTRSCGNAGGKIDGPEGYEWGATKIKATGLTCKTAKRHIKKCMASGRRPSGWGADQQGGSSVLMSGDRRIQWTPVGGGGCGS